MAPEFPNACFVKVDVDENQEVAAMCKISAMPTFKVFRDKQEVGKLTGANERGLKQLVAKHAGGGTGGGGGGNGAPPSLARQASGKAGTTANGQKWSVLAMGLLCALLPGVSIGVLLAIYYTNGGPDAPCDAPVGFFLFLLALINIPVIVLYCCQEISTFLCGKRNEEGKVVRPPLANVAHCLIAGVNIFAFYWFIRGNMFVFGSYPMSAANATALVANGTLTAPSDAMAEGNIAPGLGCEPGMWWGAHTWLMFTYIFTGSVVGLVCCCGTVGAACCVMAKGAGPDAGASANV